MTDEEEFFAWLDGELDDAAAARVAARVKGDPALQAMAEEHRSMTRDLRAAFDPVMTEAPEELMAAPSAQTPANDNRPWWHAVAAAAALAVAFVGGTQFGEGNRAVVGIDGDQLVATASLEDVLENGLTSRPEGDTRIGITFLDVDGDFCRSFSQSGNSGLACKKDGLWRIEGLFAGEPNDGEVRMASGSDPRLAEIIDARIDGEALDAEAEVTARSTGWNAGQ